MSPGSTHGRPCGSRYISRGVRQRGDQEEKMNKCGKQPFLRGIGRGNELDERQASGGRSGVDMGVGGAHREKSAPVQSLLARVQIWRQSPVKASHLACQVDGKDAFYDPLLIGEETPASPERQTINPSQSRLSTRHSRVNGQVGSMRSPAVRVSCPCRMRRWMIASTIRILRSSTGPRTF